MAAQRDTPERDDVPASRGGSQAPPSGVRAVPAPPQSRRAAVKPRSPRPLKLVPPRALATVRLARQSHPELEGPAGETTMPLSRLLALRNALGETTTPLSQLALRKPGALASVSGETTVPLPRSSTPEMRSLVMTAQDWPRMGAPIPMHPSFGAVSSNALIGPLPAFLPPDFATDPSNQVDVADGLATLDLEPPSEPQAPGVASSLAFLALSTLLGLLVATIVILCIGR